MGDPVFLFDGTPAMPGLDALFLATWDDFSGMLLSRNSGPMAVKGGFKGSGAIRALDPCSGTREAGVPWQAFSSEQPFPTSRRLSLTLDHRREA